MTNMLTTIVPKSDQLNADDLIGRTITIKVNKVSLLAGDQPVSIGYDGDGGKPYKPCKSMRRVLVSVWGSDGSAYVGRSMTLYRDEKVTFGAMAVGGIRISHMSHIDKPVTLALTATRANRKPFTVQPLKVDDDGIDALKVAGREQAKSGSESLKAWWGTLGGARHKQLGAAYLDEIKAIAAQADKAINADPDLMSAEDGDHVQGDIQDILVSESNEGEVDHGLTQ